jgi:hypothetical protein
MLEFAHTISLYKRSDSKVNLRICIKNGKEHSQKKIEISIRLVRFLYQLFTFRDTDVSSLIEHIIPGEENSFEIAQMFGTATRASEKIALLAKMDPNNPKHQAQIVQAALKDRRPTVRFAATNRLSSQDRETLLRIAGNVLEKFGIRLIALEKWLNLESENEADKIAEIAVKKTESWNEWFSDNNKIRVIAIGHLIKLGPRYQTTFETIRDDPDNIDNSPEVVEAATEALRDT